jgi:predicted component of type VI protein secretion system
MGCLMPAQLLALTEGPSIFLDKPILLFGRDLECDIRFDSRKISRKHCCIAQVGDYLVVRDLGSTNGVRINGVRVVEGCLRAGDELTIGNHRYQVRWDELAMAPSRPPHREHRPRAAPDREAGRPADDEMLELCDDPVPLSEGFPPLAAGKNKSGPQAPVNSRRKPADGKSENLSLRADDDDISPIIPDHLDLAHASDSFDDKPPQSPGSA